MIDPESFLPPDDWASTIADVFRQRRDDPVVAGGDESELRARLATYDFATPRDLGELTEEVARLLREHAVRSDHPRYFGLFNPPALPAAMVGDALAAAINPQLAVRGHAPAAAAIERRLVETIGVRAWPGLAIGDIAGHFTSGGSEANATALMAALASRYPDWASGGVAALPRRPALYVSAQSHLAWIKIARNAGLGVEAVRLVPTCDGLHMTGEELATFLTLDAEQGFEPVLIVATMGTTGHGGIDDVRGLSDVARRRGAHLHVDAAWAGALLLSENHRGLLDGIELADSITVDPHKWMSVSMGAGLFLARSWEGLEKAFSVSTSYMPSASIEQRDAYIHSYQWSRRFIGLKLFLAMANLGLSGYARLIDRAFPLAAKLREGLERMGWVIENDTPLPLVCFTPPRASDEQVEIVERHVAGSSEAWISGVLLRGRRVLRACITSFETREDDVDRLIELLDRAWRQSCER